MARNSNIKFSPRESETLNFEGLGLQRGDVVGHPSFWFWAGVHDKGHFSESIYLQSFLSRHISAEFGIDYTIEFT